MFFRWSKRELPTACPSGGEWTACNSGPKIVECCTKANIRPAAFELPRDEDGRPAYLWRREQELEVAVTSIATRRTASSTSSNVARNTPSAITGETSPSSSAAATYTPSSRPNMALIAGASAGGFVFLLLIGIVIFFWLHTQKSRRHHNRTFERRLSDPIDAGEMAQKQLLRVSIVAEPEPPHARHQRKASHVYISPTTTTERRASQHASRSIDADPHTYRHYSAEDFRLPQSPATVLDAWKTSHRPSVTPTDLWRKSIGTFELDSPLSPEQYRAATSRKSSLGTSLEDVPRKSSPGSAAASRKSSVVSSMASGSRKSSLRSVSPVRQMVPIPPLPPPAPAAGVWNTHRKSLSSSVL